MEGMGEGEGKRIRQAETEQSGKGRVTYDKSRAILVRRTYRMDW